MTRRSRMMQASLFLVFIVVPLIEIYVLVQVGQVIGAGWTIALLLLDGLLGTWLIKHEGGRAWRGLRDALDNGRMPATELADGALILIGGTLMLSPGFVTDAFGILLILPVTRPLFRRLLTGVVTRRLVVLGTGPRPGQTTRPGPRSQGTVVQGEVIDDDADPSETR